MMLNYLLLWDYMGGRHAAKQPKARGTERFADHPVSEQEAFRRAMLCTPLTGVRRRPQLRVVRND